MSIYNREISSYSNFPFNAGKSSAGKYMFWWLLCMFFNILFFSSFIIFFSFFPLPFFHNAFRR